LVLFSRVGFDAGFGLVEAVDKSAERLQECFNQGLLIAVRLA